MSRLTGRTSTLKEDEMEQLVKNVNRSFNENFHCQLCSSSVWFENCCTYEKKNSVVVHAFIRKSGGSTYMLFWVVNQVVRFYACSLLFVVLLP